MHNGWMNRFKWAISLRNETKKECTFEGIIGKSAVMQLVYSRMEQVAPTDSVALILGETGTGKGVIARTIHELSKRKKNRMVTVNCAALTPNLIESELFGREKGAYTGSTEMQIGRFELADKGTLVLDEITELPLDLQAKLLRAIQDGEFERLGSPKTIKVDARILALTSRNLKEEVSKGRFRQDLYYRLNVFPITMPPLRERNDDIPFSGKAFRDTVLPEDAEGDQDDSEAYHDGSYIILLAGQCEGIGTHHRAIRHYCEGNQPPSCGETR